VYFGDPPKGVPRAEYQAFVAAAVEPWKNGSLKLR